MPVWKSPVLYIGIVLVLAVAAALMAPLLVDLSAYRAGLEDYGRKLTGRTVTIGGPISARLFPWPRLVAEDVHVANPPGMADVDFATADRVVVRMSLAGLFSGSIQVESIEVEKPIITLERRAEGQGNWGFVPASDLGESKLLDRVRLDRIVVVDGVLRLIDRRRGGEAKLENFNALLSAPGIAGPWRMRAAVSYRGRPLDIGLNTTAWRAGEALRFGLRIAPGDNSGLVYNFDGANESGKIAGLLLIEPAAGAEGKEDVEGSIRPLMFKAKVAADFDQVSFDSIEIAPRDPSQGGTLVSGGAKLTLGSSMVADAQLSASKIDLDQYAGAEARKMLREGGGLALADSLLGMLPEAVTLKAAIKISALATSGETLENVVLRLEAAREAIRVHELSATMPGRSRGRFEGIFFPGSAGAELAGRLALEAGDLRELAGWVWPESGETISKYWTGSRGRLKLQTDISMSHNRLGFADARYEIDGIAGTGEFSRLAGGRVASDLKIEAAEIDIDAFAPGGIAAMSGGGPNSVPRLLMALLPGQGADDLRLNVQTGLLRLNGVEAHDLVLDLASSAKGLDLRALKIASVGGARLEASGLILDAGKGPDGRIEFQTEADDPRGLLQLLGLLPGDQKPAWATGLGKTTATGEFAIRPSEDGSSASIAFHGTSGQLNINLAGTLQDGHDIAGTVDIEGPSSAAIARLLGLEPVISDSSPGRLVVTAEGSRDGGFKTGAQAQLFGARFDFDGRVETGAVHWTLDGKASARSTDLSILTSAAGLPSQMQPGGVLVLDAEIASNGGKGIAAVIEGRIGDARLSGRLALDHTGKVTGNLETGDLALLDVVSAVFFEWSGQAPEFDTAFSAGGPFGLTGELWIAPAALRMHQGFDASEAQIGITATATETRLAVFGKDNQGRKTIVEVSSRPESAGRSLAGKIVLPVDLARHLRLSDGAAIASGEGSVEIGFESRGRSAAGALAALKGSGSYSFSNLRLLNIAPAAFSRIIAEARDSAGLNRAFAVLAGGGELAAGNVSGSITIDNGVAAFLPFLVKTQDANATVKTVAELVEGKIDTSIILDLKAMAGLPSMEIAYAGSPSSLARSEDNAALSAALGFQILQRGVNELERLQQEQLRLAAEEEKQRKEDEAKLLAYYAQRDENRLRQRELKIHERVRQQEAETARIEAIRLNSEFSKLNRTEMAQRQRELRIQRRLARLAQQQARQEPLKAEPKATQVPVILVPPAPQKPARKPRSIMDLLNEP